MANIQKPQLIGIICGIIVFSLTILTVIILLFKSGVVAGALGQMKQDAEDAKNGKGNSKKGDFREEDTPELYDELIEAANSLPLQPSMQELKARTVRCRSLTLEEDSEQVSSVCDGSAVFHASAYDARSIWKHLTFIDKSNAATKDKLKTGLALEDDRSFSVDYFKRHYGTPLSDGLHVVIIDEELDRPIGMLSLVDNNPSNLTVRIDNLWITPAFRSSSLATAGTGLDLNVRHVIRDGRRRVAKEALFAVLAWLFEEQQYRRVTVEVDTRHTVLRQVLTDSGFMLEATLRKHRIVNKRNRDTALYVLLNSDWKLGARAALALAAGMDGKRANEKKGK